MFGGLPDTPAAAPTRSVLTSESVVAVDFLAVAGDNGATIDSYNVEIDDGNGGDF